MEAREQTRSGGRALVLIAAFAAIAAIEHLLLPLSPSVAVAALSGVVILVWVTTSVGAPAARDGGRWVLLGAAVAFALGIFFRLRYLTIVPVGWGDEPLAFVRFAHQLVEEGFPYIPYSWYAHTLYSYFIAAAMLVTPSDLMAFRIASAGLSIATLLALYLALRQLFDRRVAAVAVALLASSFWHLFASRNGYHQQLLPLFQSLFVYGLVDGLLRNHFRGWLIAAAAMTAGLHAHWGFYLMPVYAVAVWLYLYLCERALWRRQSRSMMVAALVATIWSSPLALFFYYNTQTFDYVLRGFTPGASSAPSLVDKLSGNLRYLGWALSGNPLAPVEFGTQLDPFVAAAALVGLAVSLRWLSRSVPHALLVLLLAVNVAGLFVTLASIFYITATLVAVYGLAAVGVVAVVDQIEAKLPRMLPLAALGVVVAIGWQARHNYEEFFGQRIFSELRDPFRPPGTFFLLMDGMRESTGRRAVLVARDEPGRDFDAPLNGDGEALPAFAFVAATQPFNVETVLFAPLLVGDAEAIEIWVPNAAVIENVVLPTLRRFYPGLEVTAVVPPEPYSARGTTAVAFRLEIPRADVVAYHGLRDGKGLLYAPADARYQFRTLPPGEPGSLLVHDEVVELDDGASPSLLLERGLHPLRVIRRGSGQVEMRLGDGAWQPIESFSLNANGHTDAELAPYIASPGRTAEFFYQQRLSLPRPGEVRAVEIDANGGFVTAGADAIRWHAADGRVERELAVETGVPLLMRHTSDGLLRVDEDGTWWQVDHDGFRRGGVIGCAPAEIIDSAPPAMVCRKGSVREIATETRELNERKLQGEVALLADAASLGDEIVAADEVNGRLWRFDRHGELVDWRVMAGLYFGSEVEADDRGNLYVKRWGSGIKAYSPDGYLLFHPTSDRPALFMRGADLDADTSLWRRLRLRGDRAVTVGAREFVYRFERVLAAPASAR